MKRTLIPLPTLSAIAFLIVLGSKVNADIIVSNFSTDHEGWSVFANGASNTPDYMATGGNPGGMIQDTDAQNGVAWFFSAPAKFLGDQSRHIGTELRFDLNQTGSGTQFNAVDVRLLGGGLTIDLDIEPGGTTGNPPIGGWRSYVVQVDDSSQWELSGTSTAATLAEIQTVLGSLTDLRIRGEYIAGSDTGRLDNVSLGNISVPEPSSVISLAALLGCLMARRSRPARKD